MNSDGGLRFHRMNSMAANENPSKRIERAFPPQQASACFAWQAAIHPQPFPNASMLINEPCPA
jgi:hypothetical protein